MSIFHCQAKAISRAAGRSATAAAAYRAGERIIDERTGDVHDYRRKKGILRTQIFAPQGVRIPSRSALWNMAEAAEKRKDAKVAREWEVALPSELGEWERASLAYDFAKELVKRYGVAVDVCIHTPGKKGDDRNFHAHILTSTRVLTPDGFGEKTRVLDSPRTSGQEVTAIRELWAWQCNLALALRGIDAQLDHRSLKAQGIDMEPTRHLGVAASSMERRGVRSLRGDENRRRLENHVVEELTALQKIENGVNAARERHTFRKQRAAETAERQRRERSARFWADVQERKSRNQGMSREGRIFKMDNKDEELIFDFMAAAEDTGKRLDALIKTIPGTLQKTLSDEYQRSPWLATLPKDVECLNTIVQRADSAAERTESATAHMERRIKTVCFVACLAAVIMPLATWGLAYWQTSKLRGEQAVIKVETERLQGLAVALDAETGGGVLIEKDDSGKRYVRLPLAAEVEQQGHYPDGRFGFVYTLPLVKQ
jgi:hypothetical protein